MKRKLLTAVLSLTIAFLCAPAPFYAEKSHTETESGQSDAAQEEELKVGDKVEDFTITLTNGSDFTLSEALKDHKAVFVNIWATFCQPCKMEFPALNAAANKYSDDIYVLAASGYQFDDNNSAAAFKEALNLDLHMAGYDQTLGDILPYKYFPTSYMINQDGVVCWKHVNGIPDEHVFDYMFGKFAKSDSPESMVGFEIPEMSPELCGIEPVSEEELAAALDADPAVFTFHNSERSKAWPFLAAEGGGLTASNAGYAGSFAELDIDVKASAGDILRVSTTQNVPMDSQCLRIASTNGDSTMNYLFDKPNKEYDYKFGEDTEDGIWHISLKYIIGEYSTVSSDQFFNINSVRLLTGDEAESVNKEETSYPVTLEGSDMALEIADDLEKIHFWTNGEDITNYLGADFYLSDKPVRVRLKTGPEIDPENILICEMISGYALKLADCETDETGFLAAFDPVQLKAVNETYIEIGAFNPITGVQADTYIDIFPDTESLDDFCIKLGQRMGKTFLWGNEEGPSESGADTSSSETEGKANEEVVTYDGYAFRFVDQSGEPVEGAILLVCDDSSCSPYTSDADGMVQFDKTGTNFNIHVLSVPEGYTYDTTAEIEVPVKGILIPVIVEKQP